MLGIGFKKSWNLHPIERAAARKQKNQQLVYICLFVLQEEGVFKEKK